jgi:hypothetical protein
MLFSKPNALDYSSKANSCHPGAKRSSLLKKSTLSIPLLNTLALLKHIIPNIKLKPWGHPSLMLQIKMCVLSQTL